VENTTKTLLEYSQTWNTLPGYTGIALTMAGFGWYTHTHTHIDTHTHTHTRARAHAHTRNPRASIYSVIQYNDSTTIHAGIVIHS
jgi:hypothetical protein